MKSKSMRAAPPLLAIVLGLIASSNLVLAKVESVTSQASSEPVVQQSIEVRKITPPKLEGRHLGKKILCHRPMRRGSPKLGLEQQGDKLIVHNYGHGGSGWTLGPGSAKYVIDLLEKASS